jgi:tight adherence protein C
MIYLIAVSAALAVGLVVLTVAQLIPARSAAVTRRVEEVATLTPAEAGVQRRRRQEQRDRLEELLEVVGAHILASSSRSQATRELLTYAGYRSQRAPAMYWGIRIAGAAVLAGLGAVTLPILGASALVTLLASFYLGALGYIVPLFIVRSRARKRQKQLILTLPDALDLLVVCVEAGLGLNQAFVRVAEEIYPLSALMSEELHLLNLEIRAGVARDEALRNLFERTGVEDIRSLSLMLIQADRFGTSIANALRVHAETLRDKRKQRAEEAAAKTTIKLIFPLVICIFPAMFVVLVGPGLIQIVEALSGVGG